MPLLGIREFSRRVSRSIEEVVETREPVVITKHGRAIAAVVPLDDERLEDFVLAHVPEFALGMRAADEELERGETESLSDVLAEIEGDEAPEA